MLHNLFVTGVSEQVTPLSNTNEINHWDNRPIYKFKTVDVKPEFKNGKIKKPAAKKRFRTYFTTEQLRQLEKVFSERRYIDKHEREILANELQIKSNTLKVWFQNRRMKEKNNFASQSSSPIAAPTTKVNKETETQVNAEVNTQNQVVNKTVCYEITNNSEENYRPQIELSDNRLTTLDHIKQYLIDGYENPIHQHEFYNHVNTFQPEHYYPNTYIPNNCITEHTQLAYSPHIEYGDNYLDTKNVCNGFNIGSVLNIL